MPLSGEARKEYARKHYETNKGKYAASSKAARERKNAKFNALKDKPCADCGVKYHPAVMEFDHLGDKVEDVSTLLRLKGWQTVLDEIAKCELVCANCHRMRTWHRNQAVG